MKKKYSTDDNIKFMFNLAWNNQKSLIFILIIMAITTAGIDILELYSVSYTHLTLPTKA